MLKKLMLGTALSAFALSGALAQATPDGKSTPQSPPGLTTNSPDQNAQASPPSNSPAATTGQQTQAAGGAKIIASQQSSQFLASKFQGTDVIGADDKKIGDVNDVLFDQTGQIQAYVIGVGGFLGMGSKNVALAPSAFTVIKGDAQNADKLKLSMSKDELQQAQAFEPYKDPSRAATTGQGTRPGSMPNGGLGAARPTAPNSGAK